jgi:hypothetical protein
MEWKSFGNWDFSELVWLGAVLILSLIVRSMYLAKKTFSPGMWVAFGTLCWFFWRFLFWIFASRSGLIFSLIASLMFPIQRVFGTDVVEMIMLGLTIITLLLSIWGTYWVIKSFNVHWLGKGTIYWGLLLAVVVIVAVYSGQQIFKDNCFGVDAVSESLSCEIRNNLGVVGSTWVTLAFFFWALTFALRQAKFYGVLTNLWIIALEPLWIAIFFNPTRILGVILLKVIRAPGDHHALDQILTANMRTLNLLPIAAFFILIPIGLFLLRSEKLRVWWTVSASAITFAIMLGILFHSLEIGKSLFLYSTTEQIIFVFMALQPWLPLVVVSFVGNKIDMFSRSSHS